MMKKKPQKPKTSASDIFLKTQITMVDRFKGIPERGGWGEDHL